MIEKIALHQAILEQIRQIVNETLQGLTYQLYLFGSFAKGTQTPSSDIDIAIDSNAPLPNRVFVELRLRLEESTIPYVIDVINMQKASPQLREEIRKSGVRWND